MSQVWLYSILSVVAISAISFVGAITLIFKRKKIKSFLLFMVSFAAGALLGDVFIHLLPELIAEEGGFPLTMGLYILGGIFSFFILEKVMYWRHCHMAASEDHTHPLAAMNLVGGSVHNFIDGVLIAGSYLLSIPVGIATTIAVALHEIPQEMGDFGVLLHSGVKAKKALLLNFAIELTAFLGVFLVLGFGLQAESATHFIVPITIGGFLYIANADLIPELHKDVKPKNSVIQSISFLLGVGVMWVLLFLPFESHSHEHADSDHSAETSHELEESHQLEALGHGEDDSHF